MPSLRTFQVLTPVPLRLGNAISAFVVAESIRCYATSSEVSCNSLVFDFDDVQDDETVSLSALSEDTKTRISRAWYLTQAEKQLLQTVTRLKSSLLHNIEDLASVLCHSYGYDATIRRTDGDKSLTKCLHVLRHKFIVVRNLVGTDVVVDPVFKEQFQLAHATAEYNAVLNCFPDVFVGTKANLQALIRFISEWIENVYHSQKLAVPPWRKYDSLISKWLPVKYTDEKPWTGEVHLDTNGLQFESPSSVLPPMDPLPLHIVKVNAVRKVEGQFPLDGWVNALRVM